jgi:hypothetical protein
MKGIDDKRKNGSYFCEIYDMLYFQCNGSSEADFHYFSSIPLIVSVFIIEGFLHFEDERHDE